MSDEREGGEPQRFLDTTAGRLAAAAAIVAVFLAGLSYERLSGSDDGGREEASASEPAAQEREAPQPIAEPELVERLGPDDDHPVLGDPEARYALVVFTDLECPFCQRFDGRPRTVAAGMDDVSVLYRHFPLEMHGEVARDAHLAAQCVYRMRKSEDYFDFAAEYFERTGTNGRGLDEGLASLAGEYDISEAALAGCMERESTSEVVDADFALGESIGVSGTPTTLVIDREAGTLLGAPGNISEAQIEEIVEIVRGAND